MANFSLYLPDKTKAKLDKIAEQTGVSRNKLITEAIDKYLEENK